ncbi:hypothetical protein ARMSODRAFT_607070 [Armillaria solidipes]|uniref:Uncharacterized protein n=1 Tax=Armillaria solidipes TaxID=1076256 RepID=A0A2H3B5L1_9AGAR|nr:hypothetical protein ARMSODRAFT_607070 [Armillaria solidipes]
MPSWLVAHTFLPFCKTSSCSAEYVLLGDDKQFFYSPPFPVALVLTDNSFTF